MCQCLRHHALVLFYMFFRFRVSPIEYIDLVIIFAFICGICNYKLIHFISILYFHFYISITSPFCHNRCYINVVYKVMYKLVLNIINVVWCGLIRYGSIVRICDISAFGLRLFAVSCAANRKKCAHVCGIVCIKLLPLAPCSMYTTINKPKRMLQQMDAGCRLIDLNYV